MEPVRMFVSHRFEYASVARELKDLIENASQKRDPKGTVEADKPVDIFISEDIRHGAEWLPSIKEHLRKAKALILIYGAPYEDWSWCFYEAGYFAGMRPGASDRPIYCIVRPQVPIPKPLEDLQVIRCKGDLVRALSDFYKLNTIEFELDKLDAEVAKLEDRLFGDLLEFEGYPCIRFEARDCDFTADSIPDNATLKGDELDNLFGIGAKSATWAAVVGAAYKPDAVDKFVPKWLDETKDIILAARRNEIAAPQTVLINRSSRRYRTLLYRARTQADGTFCCRFLVIEDVGGPAVDLDRRQLSLLTSIRMGFRFRSEVIEKYDFDLLSDEERRICVLDIPHIIESLEIEAKTRGDISRTELLSVFDRVEKARMQKLLGSWSSVKQELYASLGLEKDGKTPLRDAVGVNMARFDAAFKVLRFMNAEFLARCCARLPSMVPDEGDLSANAGKLDQALQALRQPELKAVA